MGNRRGVPRQYRHLKQVSSVHYIQPIKVYTNTFSRRPVSWKFKVANGLVLKKIHKQLGLDCLKVAIVSGAPVLRSTSEFFMSINIPIMDMYGTSENSGPQTISTISNWRLGSVGQCMNGTQLKIDNPDKNGEGEAS